MTDRELLEMAAKAYWGDEIDDVCSIRWLDADQAIGYTHGDNQDHNGQDVEWCWNPLADDGGALRLAVKLRMGIHYETQFHADEMTDVVEVFYMRDEDGSTTRCIMQELGADADAATRRAITRAAAEIGKAMP